MAFPITRNTFRTRRSRCISLVLLALVAAGVVGWDTRSAGSGIARTVSDRAALRQTSHRVGPNSKPTLMGRSAAPLASERASWVVAENEGRAPPSWRIPPAPRRASRGSPTR